MTNKVSVYVAAGSDLQAVRNLVKRERGTVGNIKSDWTRTEITAALRNIAQYLQGIREVPPNGLVLFADSSGVQAIEPPVPCRMNWYRCGSDFARGPLDAMHDEAAGPKTGLILIDNAEATVAWFRGESVVVLWHDYSGVMGKHKMGGQSQARFQRGHDEQLKEWMRKVADVANQHFVPLGVTGVLVAGPGFRKRDFVDDGKLHHTLRVVAVVDCEYVDDVAGPREALARWRAT